MEAKNAAIVFLIAQKTCVALAQKYRYVSSPRQAKTAHLSSGYPRRNFTAMRARSITTTTENNNDSNSQCPTSTSTHNLFSGIVKLTYFLVKY